jgi:hypothetical protein
MIALVLVAVTLLAVLSASSGASTPQLPSTVPDDELSAGAREATTGFGQLSKMVMRTPASTLSVACGFQD